MKRQVHFEFYPYNLARLAPPVERQCGYRLTCGLIERGRILFKDAMQAHKSDLPELDYDHSNGWLIYWPDGDSAQG